MNTIGLRLGVAVLAFMAGVVLDAFVNTSTLVEKVLTYPVKAVDRVLAPGIEIPARRDLFDSKLPTEIRIERIPFACNGFRQMIVMYTSGSGEESEAARVMEIDVQTAHKRYGKLDSHHYRDLFRFIEEQGYFAMNDRYIGTIQGSAIRSSVTVGPTDKSIVTYGEGDMPLALSRIHNAIERALIHVSWEFDSSQMVSF